MTRKKYIIIFLAIGLLGGLLFFPIQIDETYTCFYHRIFDNDHPAHEHKLSQNMQSAHSHGSDLVDIYVSGYGIFWWSSLIVVAYSIYRLRKIKSINQ